MHEACSWSNSLRNCLPLPPPLQYAISLDISREKCVKKLGSPQVYVEQSLSHWITPVVVTEKVLTPAATGVPAVKAPVV